jgi:hypothetical protein
MTLSSVGTSGYAQGMGWSATSRYELPRAPGGLVFAQELLNTRPARGSLDLLAHLDDAQRWLDESLEDWSLETGVRQDRVTLTEADVGKLRDLRADLNALVVSTDRVPGGLMLPATSVSARLGTDGQAVLEPRGEGSRRVGAIVLIEIFTAQRLDTWRRLKVCRNDRCGVSFYDRSRNNSGVWHDARMCGNAVHLRASRARRRYGGLGAAQAAHRGEDLGADL